MLKRIAAMFNKWSSRDSITSPLAAPFEEMFDSAPIGFVLSDINTHEILRINQHMCNMLGYSSGALCGKTLVDLVPSTFIIEEQEHFALMLKNKTTGPFEYQFKHKNGDILHVIGNHAIIQGHVVWSVLQDVTEQKDAEKTIFNLAYYDQITGLPNRTYFLNHAESLINSHIEHDPCMGIFLIDVDNFNRINDTLGHLEGDKILNMIGQRINHTVEKRCETENMCTCFSARLGGDEFVVIFNDIKSIHESEMLADQIITAFDRPFVINNGSVPMLVSVSIGVSIFPEDGKTITTLLKSADLALNSAKTLGKRRYVLHTESLNQEIEDYVLYENAIRYFIQTEDFDLFYQPFYDVNTDKVIGAEALFRGNYEKFGHLDLETVIHIAEETGLIIPLGQLIFKRACIDCKSCDKLGPDRRVSTNFSVRQLQDPTFVNMIKNTIEQVGVDPHNMAIEVTETMLMVDGEETVSRLNTLRETGMMIYIDDFGKGYSSMSNLHELPADTLKIDMSFIAEIETNDTSYEVVKGIINLGHALGLHIVAEGVENQEQLNILKLLGVDVVQGFFIGRPLPLSEFVVFIHELMETS